MDNSKRVPCNNCPFRKVGGIRLTQSRITEIAVRNEGDFPCHKTTVDSGTGDGQLCATKDSKQCAGFLIFREKALHPNQMMRIAERLRLYDARRLMEGNPAVADIFDSLSEMRSVHRRESRLGSSS